jgi:hypothetical protein
MSVTLACTWNPRGEISRLIEVYPQLVETYEEISIVLPPDADLNQAVPLKNLNNVSLVISQNWSWGRYLALKKGLEANTSHIQYADLDRLVRWIETQPADWRRTVTYIQDHDCVVIGRTEKAWDTHPEAIRQTEKIPNQLFSQLLGKDMDFSAGSKGFSRAVAAFIMSNSQPGHALGTDAEWVVLAHRGGFRIKSILVDGLDWESADRYRDHAASRETQRQRAIAYDAQAENWEMRVQVAIEIVESGLDALNRDINQNS